MKQYRAWNPDEAYLLPPSARDWLPESHLASFLLDVVSTLDIRAIEDRLQSKDARGVRPHHPVMMVTLLLYGYCVGVFSSRRIARATHEDVPFRVIAGETHPDHTCISEFRREHLDVLKGLFVQVLALCRESGLVKLGHVALDGTKVEANASKHKAMSYARMQESERKLQGEIEALMRQAETVDGQEDKQYGKDKSGDELPEELARRNKRLETIRAAKARLEAEAAAAKARDLAERAEASARAASKAEAAAEQLKREKAARRSAARAEKMAAKARDTAKVAAMPEPVTTPTKPSELPAHQVDADKQGNPKARAQMNFTDPESRIMKGNGAYVQGYNCQAAVDSEHQIIVAEAVTNQPPDCEHFEPMMDAIKLTTGSFPQMASADAGYFSAANVSYAHAQRIDPYIATRRDRRGKRGETETRSVLNNGDDPKSRMRAKLDSVQGKAIYSRRKVIVEPVFGQIKGARGFRRFLLRGVEKARGEWSFVCTTHNLLKLWRARNSKES